MKFVIIFVIASVSSADVLETTCINPTCTHPNETYQACFNGCEYTCDNYATAGACAPGCKPELAGCYCNWGFVRNRNGVCVSQEDCTAASTSPTLVVEPQQPFCNGQHESFIAYGTLCPLTCATKNRVYKCKAGSQPGCFCNKGYLRNSKNICVPIAQCD